MSNEPKIQYIIKVIYFIWTPPAYETVQQSQEQTWNSKSNCLRKVVHKIF